MEMLKNSDFSWHRDQADVPGMTADEMKAFLDAPIEVLMEKLNEIIGGEDEQSLARLSAALTEAKTALSQKAEKTEVEAALANLETVLREDLASKANASEVEAALANLETVLREDLASKANASDVNDGLMYLENRLQEENLLPLTASVDELRLAQEDHAREISELAANKQNRLTAGEGISIVGDKISAQVNAEFTAVQDDVTSDLPMGLIRFEDPGDESRTVFNLYLLQDNGNGGIEPGTGLSVPTGSVGVKSKAGQGYLLVVFCNRADGGGYLIHNGGLEDSLTEMAFSQYVKTTDLATATVPGVVKVNKSLGINIALGVLTLSEVNQETLYKKSSRYYALTPANIDDVIKAGLTTNALAWTEEEKAAARALLGIE